MDFINEDIEDYAHEHSGSEGELLAQLEKETYETLEIPQMTTGRIEGRFLKMLAQLIGAKRILEIGTFGGYASLSMAEALPDSTPCRSTIHCRPLATEFYNGFVVDTPRIKNQFNIIA